MHQRRYIDKTPKIRYRRYYYFRRKSLLKHRKFFIFIDFSASKHIQRSFHKIIEVYNVIIVKGGLYRVIAIKTTAIFGERIILRPYFTSFLDTTLSLTRALAWFIEAYIYSRPYLYSSILLISYYIYLYDITSISVLTFLSNIIIQLDFNFK